MLAHCFKFESCDWAKDHFHFLENCAEASLSLSPSIQTEKRSAQPDQVVKDMPEIANLVYNMYIHMIQSMQQHRQVSVLMFAETFLTYDAHVRNYPWIEHKLVSHDFKQ